MSITNIGRFFCFLTFLIVLSSPAKPQQDEPPGGGATEALPLITRLDTISRCPGDFWLPIRISNATNIGAISLKFNFNPTVIQYLGSYVANPAIYPTGFLLVGNYPADLMSLIWYASPSTPANIINDTLIKFRFHYSGGVSFLNWSVSECSYANINTVTIENVLYVNGEVNSNTFTSQITAQPQSINLCEGYDTSFSIGTLYGISHQWQVSTNGGLTWGNLANNATYSGVTSTTLHLSNVPLSFNGYQYRCVITDICTFETFSQAAVLTIQVANAVSAGPDTAICSGLSYTLTGTSASTTVSLNWTSTGSGSLTGAASLTPTYTPSVADIAAGQVKLILTGEGLPPCNPVMDTMILTIYPLPIANAGNDTAICLGGEAYLHGTGGAQFTWSTDPPQSTQDVTVTPLVTTTYYLTVSNFGCVDYDNITVTVQPGPVINAGEDVSICAGDSVILSGSVQYVTLTQWHSYGDGTFSNPAVLNPVYTPGPIDISAGSVTLVLTGLPTSPCLVPDSNTLLLTIIPLPDANAGSDKTVCSGQEATLSASGGLSYLWSTVPPEPTQEITVSPPVTTTYYVTVSNTFCSAVDSAVVIVLPLPVIHLTPGDTSICSGTSITLASSGGLTYLWSTGSLLSAISVSPTSNTLYTVTVTDIHSCQSVGSVSVTVNPSLNSSVSPLNTSICEGGSITLTASSNHPAQFTWSPGTGLSNTSGPVVIASPVATTTYTLSGLDALGCTSVTEFTLMVYQNPPVEVHPAVNNLCKGDTILLTAYGASTYYWSPPTGLSANNLPTVMASPKNTTSYELTGTDIHGCKTTVTAVINVLPVPAVTLLESVYICRGEKYLLDGNGHLDSCTYQWQDGNTMSYMYVTEPGVYYVKVNRKGCIVTDTIHVLPCSELWIPNAFSPNNDGINDLFYVVNTGDVITFKLTIYNRWGERVFDTDNIYEPWDGNFDGKRCPVGVYHYVVEYLGQGNVLLEKEGKKYGQITLFR